MNSIFGVPLSGLQAQSKRLAVSAENVANVSSQGVRPDQAATDTEGFVPHRVLATAAVDGGVQTERVPVSPAAVLAYDPGAPDADAQGLVARPNVSLEEEAVIQLQAKRVYQANLKVVQALDQMLGNLLDVRS